ncbi:MAG: 50S ribosomal protein L3 [Waddliaceae bacterium]
MALKLMGKKVGMAQLFNEQGHIVVCTVIHIEPNVVTQIKTKENDSYQALQLGYKTIRTKDARTIEERVSKPRRGHFNKAGVEPKRYLMESRMDLVEDFSLGQEIGVEAFEDVPFVDVIGISIGKGYQGAMKLHNFRGQPASHGAKKNHRSLGSTGNRSTPGRCFPGGKRASRMGGKRVTVQNLEVIAIDKENHLIILKGAVPGHRNGMVALGKAGKRSGAVS